MKREMEEEEEIFSSSALDEKLPNKLEKTKKELEHPPQWYQREYQELKYKFDSENIINEPHKIAANLCLDKIVKKIQQKKSESTTFKTSTPIITEFNFTIKEKLWDVCPKIETANDDYYRVNIKTYIETILDIVSENNKLFSIKYWRYYRIFSNKDVEYIIETLDIKPPNTAFVKKNLKSLIFLCLWCFTCGYCCGVWRIFQKIGNFLKLSELLGWFSEKFWKK